METPVVLLLNINSSSPIRSAKLKEYFAQLTSNVEVLYPTTTSNGLLLCKSKRTEEKICGMRHVLSDGSIVHLSTLSMNLFQSSKCLMSLAMVQSNGISSLLQQCLPFLHATGGKIQIKSDGSMVFEGHVAILNALHSFLLHQISKTTPETFEIRSGNISTKILSGKVIDQSVEGVLIPMNDKYQLHRAFDQQMKENGGTAFSNYFKELSNKGTRAKQGEIIIFPNREIQMPAKFFIAFIVPHFSSSNKDFSSIDSFQSTYEQMIIRALNQLDQQGITSLAMPLLEPSVKNSFVEKRQVNRMAFRAVLSALRQFSRCSPAKLRRFVIVDHSIQIKRINRRVKKYQKQVQKKISLNSNVDLDLDDGQSFVNIFGVPKIPQSNSSSSDSEDVEPVEYQLPYPEQTKF